MPLKKEELEEKKSKSVKGILKENPDLFYTAKELAKKLEQTAPNIRYHFDQLEKEGELEVKKNGRIKYVSWKE